MPHVHDHHDHHNHAHGATNFGAAFAIATALNLALVVAQVVYGLAANSVALLADAGHNFGDALGLLLAWGAYLLGRAAPTERFTYGFRSARLDLGRSGGEPARVGGDRMGHLGLTVGVA